MKTISNKTRGSRKKAGELRSEYSFDYSQARPDRVAAAAANAALRTIISAIPDRGIDSQESLKPPQTGASATKSPDRCITVMSRV